MAAPPPACLAARVSRVRRHLSAARIDALLVTHPPNLLYLTGLRATTGALILTPSDIILVVDPRYVAAAREAVASLAVQTSARLEEAPRALDEAVAAVLGRLGAGRVGVESAHLTVKRFQELGARLRKVSRPWPARRGRVRLLPRLVATEGLVERERLLKDSFELATIRQAARRVSDVARLVPGFLRPERTEREVAADIDNALRRAGFERPAFDTIVASGPQSGRPHARPTERRLRAGDAVVLDFGGVYDGYCVDLSRTACLGRSSGELERMHAAVLAAQEAALAAVRPGALASAVDAAAREVLEEAGLGDAFVHGTGHGLGLDVHEDPRLGRAQEGAPDPRLEAGMVLTVEPGVYVPAVGGVRIEDDVLVVVGGREVLTDAPRALWVIA